MKNYTVDKMGAWWHVALWTGYFVFEFVLARIYSGEWSSLINAISHFGINTTLFYTLYLTVFPKLSWTGYLAKAVSLMKILATITLFVLTKFSLDFFLLILQGEPIAMSNFELRDAAGHLYRATAFAFPAIGMYNLIRFNQEKELKTSFVYTQFNKMVKERTVQKLTLIHNTSMLNGHLDYHCLYSTVNYIDTRIAKKDQDGKRTVGLLIEMLRYTTSGEWQKRFVSLIGELEQLEIRKALKEIREDKSVFINIQIPNADYYVPKSILMPVFLKLLKHCDVQNECSSAKVIVETRGECSIIHFDAFPYHYQAKELVDELLLLNEYLQAVFDAEDLVTHNFSNNLIQIAIEIPRSHQ